MAIPANLFVVALSTLLLFTSCYPRPAISTPHNNITDLSALVAFKAQIGDPNGILARSWTTNTSFCTWIGVSCSRRRERVTALDLHGYSLGNTISPHLTNLSFMSYLNLGNNTLVGPIPDALGHLPRLRFLVLERNQLSGAIPPAIFNMSLLTTLSFLYNNLSGSLPDNHGLMLPRLQRISLSANLLSGKIPWSFARCRDLQILSLSRNQFRGSIPAELGNLPELSLLYLGQNNLTGTIPTTLGNLTKLNELDLGFNNLTGTIPTTLGNLTKLNDFALSFNNLHGRIPSELGNLMNLQILNVGQNGLTGAIPASLSNASMLDFVELSSNNLTGSVPVTLGNLPLLGFLNLAGNRLQGGLDFIDSLTNCRALETLQFGENDLDGVLPESVGNLSTHLLRFNAGWNHITGRIPVGFGNLSSLLLLVLSSNKLTGVIPSDLTRLEKLQGLALDDNRIGGSIPYEVGKLTSLVMLDFGENALSGPIPESFGNISGLQSLGLGANALSSGIPQSIWSLGALLVLNLSSNSFDGPLPPGVGNLKTADALDLSGNRLSGSIPSAIGDLQMLELLSLYNNSFQGPIPQSFGLLINIQEMDLSSNALSGVIPRSFADLRYLAILNLSFNRLEGRIPDGGTFSNLTIQSLMGNAALCGASRLGFPPCSPDSTASNSKTGRHPLKYILPAVAATLVLVACFSVLLIFQRKKRAAMNPSPTNASHLYDYRLISYHELSRATDNFCEANILGKGGFGSVFKGNLDDGLPVAIKVLNMQMEGASQSFDAECRALRMIRHRNLVKIISTCSNLDFRALVLQFMPNDSLDRWLYSHNYCLSLLQRINIMLDVALALEYLHDHHVLHCDLKPGNVLLDEDMTAHVGDFGIAKLLLGDSKSVVSASAPGTVGYMAPEYGSTGRVSRRGDVYSYGILLLETFTRKKPTDAMFDGESCLRQWVCEAHPVKLFEIVDQNLLRDEPGNDRQDPIAKLRCLSSAIELGLLCSRDLPTERIQMKDVVSRLGKIRMEYLLSLPQA